VARQANALMAQLKGWELSSDASSINRYVEVPDFKTALRNANLVGDIAEKLGHHPDLGIGWGYLDITLTSHDVDGLTKQDFLVAAQIDGIL
jgi:4a-hydroxytetrahydrobiopterin dehydratase